MPNSAQIILDTNIILRTPEILSRTRPDIRLIIPQVVYDDIVRAQEHNPSTVRYKRLIDRAVQEGFLRLESQDLSSLAPLSQERRSALGDAVDSLILDLTAALTEQFPNTYVATEDRQMQADAKRRGLKVLTLNTLLQLLAEPAVISEPLR